MIRSEQTPKTIKADFDRIALVPAETWNHNSHYHQYLLNQLPARCSDALEIGCGTGQFSRLLAERAENLLAIDLSPQMIRVAREHSKGYSNIEFVVDDVMTHSFGTRQFDCVATLTTIHHLPADLILQKIKAALKPGGVFVCLDLYQSSQAAHLLVDGFAYSASLLLRLLNTGKLFPPRELRAAYDDHGKTDKFLTLPQIESLCEKILPGAVVRRHLLWRYSIVWKKERQHPK